MPHRFSIDWFPLLPPSRIALVAGVLLALVAWGSWILARKRIPRRAIVVLGALRVVAVVLFMACLLQPAVSYYRSEPRTPELIVMLDTSTSMSRADAPAGSTRLKQTADAIQRSELLDELGRKFKLRFFAFDRTAFPLDGANSASPNLGGLAAEGSTTDFAASYGAAKDLIAAESEAAAFGGTRRRVLLVTDGVDHGGANFAEVAERDGLTVDVLPAGGASESRPEQAIVTDVQAPSRVLIASETKFVALVRRGEDGAATYELVMFEDDKEGVRRDVAFAAGVREQLVEIAHRPTETGLRRYEFELLPKGVQPAPAAADVADRYGVDVQVIDDKLEVLMLEDRWRWDFKYLKRVLEDDPSFHLTAMLARGGSAFLQMGEPDSKADLAGFPQSRAELEVFDVIVLGDVRPTRWPAKLAGAVADAVIEDGKSLIVVAGPALGEFAKIPELQALLPVELSVDSASPVEGPLEVRLTPEGARSGSFADAGKATTAPLPSIDRIYAPLRKRPAAAVLVEAAAKASNAGPLIVMAEHSVGRGRVLYVGTDALWKWQTLPAADEDGRTPYERLWQQTLRAFAPQCSATTAMRLAADRSRYQSGERVTLRAQPPAMTDPAAGDKPRKLEASVVLPDGRRIPLSFEQDPAAADTQLAVFDVSAPGRYRISATATDDGQVVAQAATAIDVVAAGTEADDRDVDHAALTRLAARTGGRVVDLADRATWPTTSDEPAAQVETLHTANLWDNLLLPALLCIVLGVDWLIRMLRGYV
jgi:hypothetical protein